jgi:hypothetical protein
MPPKNLQIYFLKMAAAKHRQAATLGRRATAPAQVPQHCHPLPPPGPTSLPPKFFKCGQLFFIGSSTCPPCLDFSLKLQTSITSVSPKKIAFFFRVKLTRRCMFKKSFFKLKIVYAQVTLTKTSLSVIRTFSPLRIN